MSRDRTGNISVVIFKKSRSQFEAQLLLLPVSSAKEGHSWLETGRAAKCGHLGGRILACGLLPSPAHSKGHCQPSVADQLGGQASPSAHQHLPAGSKEGLSPETSPANVSPQKCFSRGVSKEVPGIYSSFWQFGGMGQSAPCRNLQSKEKQP